MISRDTTNAVCHAIEAALLHGLKGSSLDKVRFSATVFYILYQPNNFFMVTASHIILPQIDNCWNNFAARVWGAGAYQKCTTPCAQTVYDIVNRLDLQRLPSATQVTEYCCPACARSAHTDLLDVQLINFRDAPYHWDLVLCTIAMTSIL